MENEIRLTSLNIVDNNVNIQNLKEEYVKAIEKINNVKLIFISFSLFSLVFVFITSIALIFSIIISILFVIIYDKIVDNNKLYLNYNLDSSEMEAYENS